MKKLIVRISAIVYLLFILLTACNSTRLISSWKAPDNSVQNYNKVLVIGLMGNKDREIRERAENEIVAALQERGISAGSAYAEYGPKSFENLDEQAALQRIRNKGYDGAFSIALLDKTKERRTTPASVRYVPQTYYNRFWGYYQTVYTRIYQPATTTVSTNYILEANFYNLTSDKLEYSAQTKSFDPSSEKSLASGFSKVIIDDMSEKGIFK